MRAKVLVAKSPLYALKRTIPHFATNSREKESVDL